MIEQKAKVVAMDDKTIWLDAQRQSTCSGCAAKQGCGTGILENHVGKRFSRIAVEKKEAVDIGQQMQLAIPEEALLQGAFMMYLLPLLSMFLFAFLATTLGAATWLETIAGIAGLFAGLLLVKNKFKNKKIDIQASVIED
jgi:sigma-E factor negative regulatory protein RseC